MEDVECLQPQEKEENFREIRDEIEALKAIYNNNEEEEEEVKEEEGEEEDARMLQSAQETAAQAREAARKTQEAGDNK